MAGDRRRFSLLVCRCQHDRLLSGSSMNYGLSGLNVVCGKLRY